MGFLEFGKFLLENLVHFSINWWWLIVPFYLFPIMYDFWIYETVVDHFRNNKYVILRISVPREQEKSPKLMENVIEGLWTVYGEIRNFMEVICEGVWQDHFSLEIAGVEGRIYFGVWVKESRVEFFKPHIYSQYPEAEIEVMEGDYMNLIPNDAPNEEWEVWGLTWTLDKPDAYPIRTYPYFQDFVTGTMVDPLAAHMELLSSLGPGEHIWYQLLVKPVSNHDWYPEFQQELEKILERGKYKEKVSVWAKMKEDLINFPKDVVSATFKYPEVGELAKEEEEKSVPFLRLSPGEQNSLKIMEENFSKRGFRVQYRTIYMTKRELFRGSNINAMMGAVNQFNSVDMNGMNLYRPYFTSSVYLFADSRVKYKKKRQLRIMKNRQFSGTSYIFNTEEVATLWHFPDMAVKAPKTPRVAAKKASAPMNLPEGEE